jgi:dTDP-4-amino-4,6-dideoxygalactose transaminase
MVIEAKKMVQLNPWPNFADDEIEAAVQVLRSARVNYWTGEQGRLFEQEFADYCGAAYGIAVANGSVGLDVALHVLGIGSGDEVIVTPRSFFASAGAIALSGATPVFADVDLDSQNITLESITASLSPRTRAILCVHLNGWPCDMAAIMALAKQHGLFVIEDCAQAHGSKIDGKFAGTWGDIGVFSFCQDKIMTTAGEGGMVLTNDKALWACACDGSSGRVSLAARIHRYEFSNDGGAGCCRAQAAAQAGRMGANTQKARRIHQQGIGRNRLCACCHPACQCLAQLL